MEKFAALLEDESDIFGGTQESKYWDIAKTVNEEVMKDEFDKVVERIAAMEKLLSETYNYEELDKVVKSFILQNQMEMEELKKSVYMELAGKLVYRAGE